MSDRNFPFINQVMRYSFILAVVFLCSDIAYGGVFDKLKSVVPGGSKDESQKGTPSVSRGGIDSVYKLLAEADALLKKSVDITFKMLANKDDIERSERRMKEIESIKDPKEKEAEIKKVYEEKGALINKETEKKETTEKVKNLNDEQKQLLGKAIYNIFLAGLMDKGALEKSKQLIQGIKANPSTSATFAGDATKLSDIASNLPSQIDKIYNLGGNLIKLAQEAKIEVALPKSSSEPPKAVELGD